MPLELEELRSQGPGDRALDASKVRQLRLVEANGPHLLQAEEIGRKLKIVPFMLRSGSGGEPLRAATDARSTAPGIGQIVPDATDMTLELDGSVSVAWSISGSGVALIDFMNTKSSGPVRVTGKSRAVFGSPAFARSTGRPHDMISVGVEDVNPPIVFFRQADDGDFYTEAVINLPWKRIEPWYAKLVGLANGDHLMLVNVREPGAIANKAPTRETHLDETRPASILEAVSLDREFRPIGPRTRPFGDVPVYEVDADRAGANVAIFATTPEGALFTVCDASGRPVPTAPAEAVQEQSPESATKTPPKTSLPAWRFPLAIPSAAPLVSPSIVQVGTELYVAALRDLGRPTARILAGRVDVSALLPTPAPSGAASTAR